MRGTVPLETRTGQGLASTLPQVFATHQADADPALERGQIGRALKVAAVHGPARAPTVRTAAAGLCAVRGDIEDLRALARDPLDAAARHGKIVVHVPAMGTTSTANNYRSYLVTIHAK